MTAKGWNEEQTSASGIFLPGAIRFSDLGDQDKKISRGSRSSYLQLSSNVFCVLVIHIHSAVFSFNHEIFKDTLDRMYGQGIGAKALFFTKLAYSSGPG